MFKKKLGRAKKYNNVLNKSLGKTNRINLEPLPILFIRVILHKSVIVIPENIHNCVKDVDYFALWCIIKM